MKKSIALLFCIATTSLFAAANATKKANADAIERLINEGVQFHEQGQFDDAIAKYKQAEKKDPKNALVKYEMAFTYHAKRDLDKALSYAKAATKLKTENIDENLYSLLGSIYDEKGMPDSALAIYREGFKKSPNSANIPYNATITYMRKNNADSAYAWIKRSINNTRTHEGSYYYAGFLASQIGKWPAFYAYTMYSTFISKKAEIIRDNLSRLYGKTKYLVIKKDNAVEMNTPNIKQSDSDSTVNKEFLLAIQTMLTMDSLGTRKLYDKDSTSAQQTEFLIYMLEKTIKLVAFTDEINDPIQRFFQGLIRERLVEAFIYTICEPIDRPTFAQWLIKNRTEQARLYQWFNKEWLML
ncbi:MAG: tetratricopeptide repeat protein [Fibrobacter sp.]|uniref:tetratricopeptide repeat protein n=1 Tax=Fibrobacter sp. TaxID=35828 RepID=UPI0025C4E38C|nr:tetratricopeptide repeat protein [Fibrobacter sp.]MBQ7079833.1 tetratricopeptide repeat protein [Fibrobacter sp.]